MTNHLLQSHVDRSIPLIIKGAASSWPIACPMKAGIDTTFDQMKDAPVTVDVTPNGLGDAPVEIAIEGTQRYAFVKPFELCIPFFEAFETIKNQSRVESARPSTRCDKLLSAAAVGDELHVVRPLESKWWSTSASDGQPFAKMYYSRQNDCLRNECRAIESISRFHELDWARSLG